MNNTGLKINPAAAAVAATVALPAAASAEAGKVVDPTALWHELWREMMWDITIIGVTFAVISLYLLIVYRRRKEGEAGTARDLSPIAAFGWAVIPVFLFMADDIYLAAKNYEIWNKFRDVPKDAYVVNVTGGGWQWRFDYPEGMSTSNELVVAAGRPVHLKLTSSDFVHSFFLPHFKTKWDAVPGKENYLWFYPKEPGKYLFTCTEFCGTPHADMYGYVKAMKPEEFDKWVGENRPKGGRT